MFDEVSACFMQLQDDITRAVQGYSAKPLIEDQWSDASGGLGRTRVCEQDACWEKIGVNFSRVMGDALPAAATEKRPELHGCAFQATGVSVVIHPQNPYVPTAHLNVRFFMALLDGAVKAWWFGGGFDLTPYYGFDEDCRHWHQSAKTICDHYHPDYYPRYKQWCDRYFFLPHRAEARGIGGLFYDDLNDHFASNFSFTQAVGQGFLQAYLPIVDRRQSLLFGERERAFQCYRRGRYAEFNLLYDRGTLFGLQGRGRVESILVSMPPQVVWRYDYSADLATPEYRLVQDYLTPRDWLAQSTAP